MSIPVTPTDQGLARASLVIIRPEGQPEIPLRFNPSEYALQKENTFEESQVQGRDAPPIRFQRGGAEKLTFEALVDTSDTLEDVRERYTNRIRALMVVNADLHAPPVVAFQWDTQVFTGVMDSLHITYVLFDAQGKPLRAKLNISLKEYREWEDHASRSSPDVEKSYVVKRGDTLSSIAQGAYKDPARWREIARANFISDPRRLQPGAVLTLPRLR